MLRFVPSRMVFLSIILTLFVFYSLLILYYWRGWKQIPLFRAGELAGFDNITIIIPARNEDSIIGALLTALQNQTYPREKVEIIVVDDHSTDKTAEVVGQFDGVKLISLKEDSINSYKKKAIESGIAAASAELIITTDADCIPPPDWLRTIVSFKQTTGAGFIVAPVVFESNPGLVSIFQSLDFMTLQGITGASVYKKVHAMCNGANLAYERRLFYEVGGFAGIDHIASGDDMLLMHKIAKRFPDKIYYLKSVDATVSTKPMPDWRTFFNQRIRWASKATHYNDKRIFWVLLLVYLFNLSFLALITAGFIDPFYWLFFAVFWIAKTIVEWPFMYAVARFFSRKSLLKYFFFAQPIHIFYTIISGLLGQMGTYEWKGRRVS